MPPKKLKYTELDLHEHVLKRPDTYVGSVKPQAEEMYVLEGETMVRRYIRYTPALERIFLEALSNAIDNIWRSQEHGTPCRKIKFEIDEKTGETVVWNDGLTIPIEIHPKSKVYIPEMVFGRLLTSSNFDDDEKRMIGGRNGVGISLTNIFSSSFKVKTVTDGQQYTQEWSRNMYEKSEPQITPTKLKTNFTEVRWIPDFAKFGEKKYTKDTLALYRRHVYECAMLVAGSKVSVTLNDEKVPVKSLADYAKLFPAPTEEVVSFKTSDSEVVLTPSAEDEHEVMSFVNGVHTSEGGVHVNVWSKEIFNALAKKVSKKDATITAKDIKKFFRIFVVCVLPNPEFSSQSKTKLTAPTPTVKVSPTMITKVSKWEASEKIQMLLRNKELATLKKGEKKRGFRKIEGVDHANFAGTKKGRDCMLILCEGESAKSYALKGMEVGFMGKKGRDYFGAYALRGKLLNTRKASAKSIASNKVVTNVIQALGLQFDVDYTQDEIYRKLNYGKIVTLADADSVTGDTPLLLRKNDTIEIKTIDSLVTDWSPGLNGKEYGITDYEVWSDLGWTPIKSVMRHKTEKKVFRVVSHTGCVDVTEDHSLMTDQGETITPTECETGTHLLHNFPKFEENRINVPDNLSTLGYYELHAVARKLKIRRYYTYSKRCLTEKILQVQKESHYVNPTQANITPEEAYVMGFFFADGTSGIYRWNHTYKNKARPRAYTTLRTTYSWSISNTNIEFLTKAKEILSGLYDLDFVIIPDRHNHKIRGIKPLYKLIINGHSKTKDFVQHYTDNFYDTKRNKIVPTIILNSNRHIREQFYLGLYDGDGDKAGKAKKGLERIDVCGKIGAMGVFYLTKSLGYEVSLNQRADKPKVYTILLTKGTQQGHPHKIKHLRELPQEGQFVYDLETKNHHFHAGVGQMIVHNTDGFHITGLIINIIHSLFPTLFLRDEPFILRMLTPVARVTIRKQVHWFYNEITYRQFIESHTHQKKDVQWYKGLASSENKDIKRDFGRKVEEIILDEHADENMEKIFGADTNIRKEWLELYDASRDVDKPNESLYPMTISDFVNRDFIKFSIDDCRRSLPHVLDGLKESQRKILYACFLDNLTKKTKIGQFSGYVAQKTNYHHGEENLYDTIIGMAQSYIGSNNIPLLARRGQFGTRNKGGKDAGKARYIFTHLEEHTRLLFPALDDVLLERMIDDGDLVEPKVYIPIIPMVLVNPNKGIGTGWSCDIPCFNPLDLIKCIRIWLEHDGQVFDVSEDDPSETLLPEIVPWYRGFTGRIEKNTEHKYTTYGRCTEQSNGKMVIDELPIGVWIDKFKGILEDKLEAKEIKELVNHSTTSKPHFTVTENGKYSVAEEKALRSYLHTSNMVLFVEREKLRKFESVNDIIDHFCQARYELYHKRKEYYTRKYRLLLKKLESKRRFILEVLDNKLILKGKRKNDLVTELTERKYYKDTEEKGSGYDYLLHQNFLTCTREKFEALTKEIQDTEATYQFYLKTSPKDMWLLDLEKFEKRYHQWLIEVEQEEGEEEELVIEDAKPKRKTKKK